MENSERRICKRDDFDTASDGTPWLFAKHFLARRGWKVNAGLIDYTGGGPERQARSLHLFRQHAINRTMLVRAGMT